MGTTKRSAVMALAAAAVLLLFAAAAAPAAERDPNQYVAFGDSITWGGGFYGYPPRLAALLVQKYGAGTVWNAGVGGEGTADGLARIDAVLAGTNSKYLLLMEGTNDASNLTVSLDTVDFNLREMCRRAIAAGWTPLLATITPRSDWVWDTVLYRSRIYDLNARIQKAADDLQITLVDAFTAFIDYPASQGGYPALLIDGLHPNSLGYDLLAETWFAAVKILKFNPPAPPLSPALDTRLDATETRKVNTITWQANLLNAALALKGYTVYRKLTGAADATFAGVGTVGPAVLSYEDGGLEIPTKYAYRITALSSVSDESLPTATVAETATFVFPPADPAVRTLPVDAVRIGSKINIVTFAANPLNDASAVSGYKVYRKKSGEPETSYAVIAALGKSIYRVSDPYLPGGTIYVYAVTAVLSDGLESKKSAPVTSR
jgi:lysophospholipase L1-like esterase